MRALWLAALATLTLAMAAVAIPATAQDSSSAANLQTLVNDLGLQIDLCYRANLPEYQRRYDQLGQAIAAWNASAKTDMDRATIAAWLRDATLSSMPGSRVPVPAVPQFDQPKPATASDSAAPSVSVVTKKPVAPESSAADEEPLPEPIEPAAQTDQQSTPPATKSSTEDTPAAKPGDASNAAPMPVEAPTAQPQLPVGPSASPAAGSAGAQPSDDANFWLDHPAADDLPPDVMLSDPFQDDPLPTNTPLPELPSLFDSP